MNMVTIKTAEATGLALDWCVAKIERVSTTYYGRGLWYGIEDKHDYRWEWSPSVNWQQGGPIKERARIDILYDGNDVVARKARMVKHPTHNMMSYCAMRGHTELVAAMRCLVASTLGDEVEVPQELLK